MTMGMAEMKPSRIDLRYLFAATLLKKGFPFSIQAMSASIMGPFQLL